MHENRETSEMSAANQRQAGGRRRSRTTRMYVAEESDSGIVPMNHSNKVEQSMAESEEGRPLIKENTPQPTRARHRAGQACHRGWRVCGKQQGKIRR